ERRRLPDRAAPGFGRRPPCPAKRLPIPAGGRGDCHALARGMDPPAAAQVDAGVADGSRLGAEPCGAEEEDIARGELREADPLRTRDFAAHLVRGPALDRVVQGGATRVLLQLVHAPDEAGTVEAAVGLDAERG